MADSKRSLMIVRSYFQPTRILECDAEASFLLPQVSYPCIFILVRLSLILVLFPGSSLSTDPRTSRHFTLLTQESPAICQLPSVDLNQSFGPVRTIGYLQSPPNFAGSSLISLGHPLEVRQHESEMDYVFITIMRLC